MQRFSPIDAGLPDDLIATLAAAVDQAFDSILITGTDLTSPGPRIVYANRACCRMTGYSRDELIGATPRILQGEHTEREVLERLRPDLERDGSFQGRATNYRRDGSAFTMEWSISLVRDGDGTPRFYIAVQRDATEFLRLLDDAERRARTDALTGLANRRSFDAHLAAVLAEPGANARVGVIALDLDRFKQVNDSYGHAAGDAVLQETARRMRAVVPTAAFVARTGGEEMTIVLDEARDRAALAALAEQLRHTLAGRPVHFGEQRIAFTASFGIAHAGISGTDPGRLALDADTALYRSKAAGRDRVTTFTIEDLLNRTGTRRVADRRATAA